MLVIFLECNCQSFSESTLVIRPVIFFLVLPKLATCIGVTGNCKTSNRDNFLIAILQKSQFSLFVVQNAVNAVSHGTACSTPASAPPLETSPGTKLVPEALLPFLWQLSFSSRSVSLNTKFILNSIAIANDILLEMIENMILYY